MVKVVEKKIDDIKKMGEKFTDNSIDQLKKFIYLLYFTCNSMNIYLYKENQVNGQIDMFIHTFCKVLEKNFDVLKDLNLKTNEEETFKKS